jgi:alpha-amylase/alpha-mannosidase (GH57 family)
MANTEHMIRPFPRYAELHQRRAFGRNSARDALRRFQTRDLRDLQVWFNLTWVHPLAVERDDGLRALRDKGRHFTEEDREELLAKHLEILREIIPLHKKLADSGQVELTTTPYFHPILPLLFDKKLAREAMPEIKLPRYTGGYPEDAAVHVRRAVEEHERHFDRRPLGMWPAEGSVCQSMLPLLARHGVRWIATDEEVLSASTHGQVSRDGKGHVRHPEKLYQAYKVREGDAELGIVFRDHALSDLIGFHYQRSDPDAAADNFLSCLYGISQVIDSDTPALVSVILDGENCWEHYRGGGVDFLRALYQRCTKTPGVKPMKIGEYLERYPPRDTLPRLFAGSWISHNFAIWIGHGEDNTAWDALHRTREYLLRRQRELSENGRPMSEELRKAWDEIYIAEGSDWFWWFGDDHSSAQDALFDYLFRKHLQNVYILLDDTPPPELGRPISRKGQRVHYTMPRAFLDVKIDGRYTFFEWVSAGRYICQNERGTMAMATQGPLEELYFGFNLSLLLIRIDCDRPARLALADFDVWRIGFAEPAGFEVRVSNPGRPEQRAELLRDGVPMPGVELPVGVDQIAEVAIPFGALGLAVDEHLQFFVELLRDGQGQDRAPREGAIVLTRPSRDFELIMWDV